MIRLGAVRRSVAGSEARGAPLARHLGEGANRARCWAVAVVLVLTGCGGAAPLLHPAQALPVNTVSFGAGVSGQFISGGAETAIDRGRAAASGPLSDPVTARAYAEGVLTHALLGPTISPWVSARVGLPRDTEAGLTYTGRSLRLDGRHVLPLGGEWALSLGLGASAVLLHPDSSSPNADPVTTASPAEFELEANGWGLDLPVLVGYQPLDGFVDVWLGARAGFERIDGDLQAAVADTRGPRFDAEGGRVWAAALAGISLGVPPVWLRFELSGTVHRLWGELSAAEGAAPIPFGDLEATRWSLAPSGALLGKF